MGGAGDGGFGWRLGVGGGLRCDCGSGWCCGRGGGGGEGSWPWASGRAAGVRGLGRASERGGRFAEARTWVGPFLWVRFGNGGRGTDGWWCAWGGRGGLWGLDAGDWGSLQVSWLLS